MDKHMVATNDPIDFEAGSLQSADYSSPIDDGQSLASQVKLPQSRGEAQAWHRPGFRSRGHGDTQEWRE
jgi:hypothetical protein